MRSYLDFEKPVAELEAKVEELRAMEAEGNAVAIAEDITRLETKAADALNRDATATLTCGMATALLVGVTTALFAIH